MHDKGWKNSLAKFLYLSLIGMICLAPTFVIAGITFNSISFNGSATATVTPGATITVIINATTSGNGANKNWKSTEYTFDGSTICYGQSAGHTQVSSAGANNETFTITAPITEGSYNFSATGYQQSSCNSSSSNTLNINNAITVASGNSAPSGINLSATSIVTSSTGVGATVGTLSATDPDSSDNHTFAVINENTTTDAGSCAASTYSTSSFQVSSNSLQTANSLSIGSYLVCVRATDNGSPSKTYKEAFTIYVLSDNNVPSDISLSNTTINPTDAIANATIGSITITDSDNNETHVTTLVDAATITDTGSCTDSSGNTSFQVDGGDLEVNASVGSGNLSAADYDICLQTSDLENATYKEQFTIQVAQSTCPAPSTYAGQVRINELSENGTNSNYDWVELYSDANTPIDMDGWQILFRSSGSNDADLTISSAGGVNTMLPWTHGSLGNYMVFTGSNQESYIAEAIADGYLVENENLIVNNNVLLQNSKQEVMLVDDTGKLVHYLAYSTQSGHSKEYDCLDTQSQYASFAEISGNQQLICSEPDGTIGTATDNWASWNNSCTASTGFSNSGEPQASNFLLAQYKFNQTEESWNGTSGEVADSTSNSNHGTAVNTGASQTSVQAQPRFALVTPVLSGESCSNVMQVPQNTSNSIQAGFDTGIDINDLDFSGTIAFWYKGLAAWNNGNSVAGHRTLFNVGSGYNNWFYLQLREDGSLLVELYDQQNQQITLQSATNTYPADQWVHIALTWHLPREEISLYLNGSEVSLTTVNQPTNWATKLASLPNLFVGDGASTYTSSTGIGNSANGEFEDLRVYNFRLRNLDSDGTTALDEIKDLYDAATLTSCCVLTGFDISQPATGVSCNNMLSQVDITAMCGSRVKSDFSGTLNLSTSPTEATLSAVSNSIDSPISNVTLNGSEGGKATVYLYYGNESNVKVSASYGAISTTDTEGTDFYPSGFEITGINNKACGGTVTFNISALGGSPVDDSCTVSGFSGSHDLKVWLSQYDIDATPTAGNNADGDFAITNNSAALPISEPTTSNVTVTFTNGEANLEINTGDAARVQVTVSNDTSPYNMSGTSSSSIFYPATFSVTNPGSVCNSNFANCSAVALAGQSKNFDIMARCSDSSVANSFTADLALAPVIPAGSSGTSVGTINNGSGTEVDTVSLIAGVYAEDLSWSEVGVVEFQVTGPDDYFGLDLSATGLDIKGDSGGIGRYLPAYFAITGAMTLSSSYRYLGQPLSFINDSYIELTAKNLRGGTTLNYDSNDYFKMATTLAERTYSDNSVRTLISTLSGSFTSSGISDRNGSFRYTMQTSNHDEITYSKTTTVLAPFNADFDLTFNVDDQLGGSLANDLEDSDGVGYISPTTISSDTDLSDNDNENFVLSSLGGSEIRYARLRLVDSHGPETEQLDIDLKIEYCLTAVSGSCTEWIINSSDSSTNYDSTHLSLNSNSTGQTLVLNTVSNTVECGEVSSSSCAGYLSDHDIYLSVQAPGEGNTGEAIYQYTVDPWFQYNWSETGLEAPMATLTFGVYRGNDKIISWYEKF